MNEPYYTYPKYDCELGETRIPALAILAKFTYRIPALTSDESTFIFHL